MELAGIPDQLVPELSALAWMDHDRPLDRDAYGTLRRAGYPLSEYGGLFAIDRGRLVSKVIVLDLAFTTASGTETIAGVTEVGTRPDTLRRGYARRLLEAVHARERAGGRDWAMLWTHPGWVAHGLYEKLGYRDIYSPPSALARIPAGAKRPLPAGCSWRSATPRDFGVLEEVFSAGTQGRLGLVPRHPNSFRLKHRAGFRRVGQHRILRADGRAVGYAQRAADPSGLGAVEVVVSHPRYARPMLDALEGEARGGWLAFGSTTFATDHRPMLARRGYAFYPRDHTVLMACSLRGSATRWTPVAVPRDPRFVCHRGETF